MISFVIGIIWLGIAFQASASSAYNQESLIQVKALTAGGIMAIGTTSGTLTHPHQGSTDVWISRLDEKGNVLWLRQLGTASSDAPIGVIENQDAIFVAGYTQKAGASVSAWVAKFNHEGEPLFFINLPPLGIPAAIAGIPAGGFIVAGTSVDTHALWLVHLEDDGTIQWSRTFDMGDIYLTSAAIDETGSIFLVGALNQSLGWWAKFDNLGQALWAHTAAIFSEITALAIQDSDIILGGHILAQGDTDPVVASANSQGTVIDHWVLEGSYNDTIEDIALDDQGQIWIAGFSENLNEGIHHTSWLSLIEQGTVSRQYILATSGSSERLRSLDINTFGDIFLGGEEDDGDSDVLISGIDARREEVLWTRRLASDPESGYAPIHPEVLEQLKQHIIPPKDTDQTIDQWLEPHYVYLHAHIQPKTSLFVYLPGSFGLPERAQLILQEAARQGYLAIGLRYPNTWTVGELCRYDPDPQCHEKVRLEIITGEDLSPHVDINHANSIENRLLRLLQFLDTHYPEEGWGQWLNKNGIIWNKIILAGHSQGGGHAALMGKKIQLERVVMFAAPEDELPNGQPVPWIATPGITPITSYFAFDHLHDPAWPKNLKNWQAMGLLNLGAIVNVGKNPEDAQGNHALTTSIPPSTGRNRGEDAHGSVVTDDLTPINPDAEPIYAIDGAWNALCFAKPRKIPPFPFPGYTPPPPPKGLPPR